MAHFDIEWTTKPGAPASALEGINTPDDKQLESHDDVIFRMIDIIGADDGHIADVRVFLCAQGVGGIDVAKHWMDLVAFEWAQLFDAGSLPGYVTKHLSEAA